MSEDHLGQVCGDCLGTRVKMEEKPMELEPGKVTTVLVTSVCRSCGGTGWLGGRGR